MTTSTLNVVEAGEFWRVARRLHSIYAELDQTFELGVPPCAQLQDPSDRSEPEVLESVRRWFDEMDRHIQVWQLRQLLQSTSLQNEENLRYLIARHLEREDKSEADKEKLDFLLVQYFAHCAPPGITEHGVTLEEVSRVLEPALGVRAESYPDWATVLDEKLQKLNGCNSLEEVQNSGALLEARELKLAVGDQYFQPGLLVAFTRFNFQARRAFFKAMHVDLHAIRFAVNELEQLGQTTVDCREAGLTENESLDQVRHVVHQWKTPFRAPYSGGSSFLQLILLRHILEHTLQQARAGSENLAAPLATPPSPDVKEAENADIAVQSVNGGLEPPSASQAVESDPQPSPMEQEPVPPIFVQFPVSADSAPGSAEDDSEGEAYLEHCVADITEQLAVVGPKSVPSVSAITLGGCKLLIATWEADAFRAADSEMTAALKRTVAARTILHVCMERKRKGEETGLGVALGLARAQTAVMDAQVQKAKDAKDIDAAVNLAATTKRLLALIDEGAKLLAS
jgi:hypothetical protein